MKFQETAHFFYFQAEVSNEEKDLHGQIVLQSTLLKAKEYFLKNGVITVNHRHRKRQPDKRLEYDPRYIVGRPISVYSEGKSTYITGELEKCNPLAQIVIELLRMGSNKVQVSIGGLSPLLAVGPDGVQKVINLFWDDVALTVAPVNNRLQPVQGVKILERKVKTRDVSAGYYIPKTLKFGKTIKQSQKA
jgi:hypothetical protein